MPPIQQNATDFQKVTAGLPYIWQDEERVQLELSETFFPGDLTQLAQFRTALLQIFPLSGAQQRTLSAQFTDADLAFTNVSQQYQATEIITNQQIIQQCGELLHGHIQNPELAKTIVNGFIGFILGVSPQLDNPQLPLKPDIVASRALRLSQIPSVMNAIAEVFKYNCAICNQELENPPKDSNANRQLTPLLVLTNQVLHCMIVSCIKQKQLPALPTDVSSTKFYIDLLKAATTLFSALSGINPNHMQITTFTVPNARCFATSRLLSLIRQLLLLNLGEIGDMKAAENLRETKRVSSFSEKHIKRLPCSRFFGFVNQQSPQIQLLQTYMQGSNGSMNYPTPLFKPDTVKCTYDPNKYSKEIDENNNLFFQHMQKINQKRRINQGFQAQDCDALTLRKEVNYQKIFQTFPDVPLKGSLEGIELSHGAFLAMKLAVDQRNMNYGLDNSLNDAQYNFAAVNSNTVKYNPTGTQQSEEQSRDSSVTSLYRDRVQNGLTRPFNYSGRPKMCNLVEDQLFSSMQLNNKGYGFDLAAVEAKFTQLFPLDLQSSLLEKHRQKASFLLDFINQIDTFLFFEALGRLGLCSIPNSNECILNRHSMPDPTAVFTNSNSASIRHIREIVSKSVVHILLLIIYHSKQESLILHRYVARLYSRISSINQTVSCLLCLPMGQYCSIADQREFQYGMCLFANKDLELQLFSADELNADCSEYLLQKKIDIDSTKPLRTISCSRRLFITISACRIAYGIVQHSRTRQTEFVRSYKVYASNYLSALHQIQVGQQPQPNPEDDSYALAQSLRMSQLVRNFCYQDVTLENSSSMGRQIQFIPTNVLNIIEFLSGQNAQNNPSRSNMAGTLQANFPGLQLSRVNNASSFIAYLKLSQHILPEIQQDQYSSVNEIPMLATTRDATIKFAYLAGVSNNSVDIARWTKETVFQGSKEKDYLEVRSIANQLSNILNNSLIQWVLNEILKFNQQFGDTLIDSQLGLV